MAHSSFGTLLKMGDGATPTENFTTVGEVLDIDGLELELRTTDSTHHSSVEGWDEVIPTILSGKEVAFEVQFDPAGPTHNPVTGLIQRMTSRTLTHFQLVFPNPAHTTWAFSAYVTNFKPSAPVDGKLVASVTLRNSGKPTLA